MPNPIRPTRNDGKEVYNATAKKLAPDISVFTDLLLTPFPKDGELVPLDRETVSGLIEEAFVYGHLLGSGEIASPAELSDEKRVIISLVTQIKAEFVPLGRSHIGQMQCPICKNTLDFAYAPNTKHTHGKCRTTNCLHWLE